MTRDPQIKSYKVKIFMEIIVRTNHPMILLGLRTGFPPGVKVNIPPVIERRDISIPDVLDAIVHVACDVDIVKNGDRFIIWTYSGVKKKRKILE